MKVMKGVVGLMISAAAIAGPRDLVKIIRAPKPVTNGIFGAQVEVVQGHLVVSSPNDTVGEILNVGSVYRFNGIGGQVALKIANPDPNPDSSTSDAFGDTLIGVGPNILIGASGDDLSGNTNAGSAYLVDSRTGAVLRKIPNPEPNAGDMFSYGALGSLGKNLIIGAPFDDPGGLGNAGTVYVFDGETGGLLLRIPHPEPLAQGDGDDRFARSVAGHEGNILAGAPTDDEGTTLNAGGAYLLDGGTGALLWRISNPEPQPGYFVAFGYPVRSFGARIVISAPWHMSGGKDLGVVRVFDGKTGALQYTIGHPFPMAQLDVSGNRAYFGWTLAEHDGFLAVGSPFDDVNGIRDAGAVYVYDLNTGALVLSIPNPNPVAGDYMGISVAFHGGQIVAGARNKDIDVYTNAGEVYVFEGPRR